MHLRNKLRQRESNYETCASELNISRAVLKISSDAHVRTFGAQNIGYFEIYGVSARTRGEGRLNQCGHFSDKGEGSNCRNFVRTSFMDGPLPLNFKIYVDVLQLG